MSSFVIRHLRKVLRIMLNSLPLPLSYLFCAFFRFKGPLSVQLYGLSRGQSKLSHSDSPSFKKNKVKILITPIFGFAQATLAAEATFAKALTQVGASVEFLACGRGLNHCMYDSVDYLSTIKPKFSERFKRKIRCLECVNSINSISRGAINKKALSLDRRVLSSKKSNNENLDIIATTEDEHATSSALRKLLVGKISDASNGQVVFENFHRSHEDYKKMLASLFDKELPDRVIMTHGIYLEHGPLIDICKERSIPVYVYNFQYRKKTICIVKGDTYHRILQGIERKIWDHPLSLGQKSRLLEYVNSKITGGQDIVNYHPNAKTSEEKIINALGIESDKPVVSFFTNVTWDANIYYSSNIYSDMLEAIFHTIEYFLVDASKQLAIRVHPAESKGGFFTAIKLKDLIEEKFPNLPNNIKIISSESDIGSYALANLSDLNIVYASNIGTELCSLGHKVMVVGEAYCRNRGFTIDPSTKNDVWDELSQVKKGSKISLTNHELAERFAYFWFFRGMIDFNFFDYSISNNSPAHFNEEFIGLTNDSGEIKDSNLSEIVSAIIDGRDFDYEKFNGDLV